MINLLPLPLVAMGYHYLRLPLVAIAVGCPRFPLTLLAADTEHALSVSLAARGHLLCVHEHATALAAGGRRAAIQHPLPAAHARRGAQVMIRPNSPVIHP